MSYEFIYEKDGAEKRLSQVEQNELAEKITKKYLEFQELRYSKFEKTEALINEIFQRGEKVFSSSKNKNWKTKVKMCKIFMLYQTLKAYIWRNIYSSPNAMFDVSGENSYSTNNSNKQKAALCDILQKMNFSKRLDKIIDNSLIYGDLIAFVGWKKHTKQVRRPLTLLEKVFANYGNKTFVIQDVTIYDNPYVYDVNPANFVFDVTQIENFDSAAKILKSFKTPEEILNNTLYKLNADAKNLLKSVVHDGNILNSYNYFDRQSEIALKDEITNGNSIEILEHWGDIRLSNGELLTNMHVVVLGRKYVIRFEKNRFIENPFVYGYYMLDPENKAPVSPLLCIYELAMLQENLYNRTADMQALNENPPIYAPDGFFTDTEIELYPGKIITYDPNLYQNVPLTPMKFSSDIYFKDIAELDNIISQVCGIYPNMSGQLEKENATATEITIKTQGQNVRLAMLLDIINQDLILPIIEKVAALVANFKFEPEILFVNKDGKSEQFVVDSIVRQGHYQYTYSDRNSYLNKISNTEQIATAFEKFAQVIPLNWNEIFKWYWEQKGVDNPERFLLQQNQITPEIISTLAKLNKNSNQQLKTQSDELSNLKDNVEPEISQKK